jgi:hypothetical protein
MGKTGELRVNRNEEGLVTTSKEASPSHSRK